MEQTQVVQSYTRHKQTHVAPENTNEVGYVVGASVIILIATVYWTLTLVILLSLGAAYGVKTIITSNPRTVAIEAVTPAPDKPKRHYASRITVNNYQGKTIKV